MNGLLYWQDQDDDYSDATRPARADGRYRAQLLWCFAAFQKLQHLQSSRRRKVLHLATESHAVALMHSRSRKRTTQGSQYFRSVAKLSFTLKKQTRRVHCVLLCFRFFLVVEWDHLLVHHLGWGAIESQPLVGLMTSKILTHTQKKQGTLNSNDNRNNPRLWFFNEF